MPCHRTYLSIRVAGGGLGSPRNPPQPARLSPAIFPPQSPRTRQVYTGQKSSSVSRNTWGITRVFTSRKGKPPCFLPDFLTACDRLFCSSPPTPLQEYLISSHFSKKGSSFAQIYLPLFPASSHCRTVLESEQNSPLTAHASTR